MTLLDRILADKRARLARGEYVRRGGPLPRGPPTAPASSASLREPGVRIVAEIKRRSPSAGEILPDADGKVETFALAYRRGHAAAISVVTEEDHFGGKPDWLPRAKQISGPAGSDEGLLRSPSASSTSRSPWERTRFC